MVADFYYINVHRHFKKNCGGYIWYNKHILIYILLSSAKDIMYGKYFSIYNCKMLKERVFVITNTTINARNLNRWKKCKWWFFANLWITLVPVELCSSSIFYENFITTVLMKKHIKIQKVIRNKLRCDLPNIFSRYDWSILSIMPTYL